MKIGVMTFWWSEDNYGQLLQCYALQKYLRDLGHDVFLIRYDPRSENRLSYTRLLKVLNPVKVVKYLLAKNRYRRMMLEQKIHPRYFELFRSRYIKQSEKIYTSYKELRENPPHADVYIVGSDQVWNYTSQTDLNYINAFTLNFGADSIFRLSYAASFGKGSLDNIRFKFADLVRGFKFISVREDSGVSICSEIGLKSVVVCDPTLLLSNNEWQYLFQNEIREEDRYIFVYMLSNTCKFSLKKLALWSKSNNLKIVYVTGNTAYKYSNYHDRGFKKYYLSINQWLSYLFNAEYIVTNSFHCCLFSILFQKKIANIPLTGELSDTNVRIATLYDKLKIDKIEIKDNDFSVLKTLKAKPLTSDFINYSKNILESELNEIGNLYKKQY
ncbi:polysaccharide pyruvyl transferase family protein [Treponema pedis]|uniref:polysaccharide pyruvyl transferase family protein n=1 Tax=Treponema pedis TaxID=409322 RepID=UPI003D1BFF32